MSKTFKSVALPNVSVSIKPSSDGVRICSAHGPDVSNVTVSTEDAPALALAILEVAGYGEEVVTDGSPDGHIQVAKYYLYEGVKAHASITAEAEAQAKLEAEALELFNTLQVEIHGILGPNWVNVTEFPNNETKRKWLAVARRAREINKEEK